MRREFRQVENSFRDLRRRFKEKEISRREFIDQLKKLRLRDESGQYWMIGAQSGKWYRFDGRDWVRQDPPDQAEKGVKCESCGAENPADVAQCECCGESLARVEERCPKCGTSLERGGQTCPVCGPGEINSSLAGPESGRGRGGENSLFRRLNPVSMLSFSGGTGLILGVLAGAFAGASGYFGGLASRLPEFLSTLHGTLVGGLSYAVLGGVLGFILFAAVGYGEALLFNLIASVIGGLKVEIEKSEDKEPEKSSSKEPL